MDKQDIEETLSEDDIIKIDDVEYTTVKAFAKAIDYSEQYIRLCVSESNTNATDISNYSTKFGHQRLISLEAIQEFNIEEEENGES